MTISKTIDIKNKARRAIKDLSKLKLRNINLEETIFFYTRNDYLIVNNFLCGNMNRLWQVSQIVNNDSKGVLKEHDDGERTLDKKSVKRYLSRIYEKLDDDAKARILKIARKDISNILQAMRPIKETILLHRNVRTDDVLPQCQLNDIVEFKIISSTSTVPLNPDYGFYRYEITVPKNGLVLELNRFDGFIRNEDDEILLPPMQCKVKNTRNGKGNCMGIIEFEYLDRLNVNILT